MEDCVVGIILDKPSHSETQAYASIEANVGDWQAFNVSGSVSTATLHCENRCDRAEQHRRQRPSKPAFNAIIIQRSSTKH